MATRSYIGKGKVYLKKLGVQGAKRRFVGNVSKLDTAITEERKEQMDYTKAGGGPAASVSRASSVDLSMVMHDFDEQNLAMGLRGDVTNIEAGTVANVSYTAELDSLVVFEHIGATSVVIKDSTGTTTFVEGTDYVVSSAGFTPLSTGAIEEGDIVKVSYSYGKQSQVSALTETAGEYELVFEGLNEAESGKAVLVVVPRNSFSPMENASWIGDEFGDLSVKSKVLKSADGEFVIVKFLA